MTKEDVQQEFTDLILPCVIEKFGREDNRSQFDAWYTWITYLVSTKQITGKQYRALTSPF